MPGINGKGILGNGNQDKVVDDYTVNDVKALFPEMSTNPLIGGMIDSGNPGMRIIADESFLNDLKALYLEDKDEALTTAAAIAECSEFLLNEDNKPNAEVLQRIQWIKYVCYLSCSVKGRLIDKYAQTATGVLTNAMTDQGWKTLNIPLGRNSNRDPNNDSGQPQQRP
jgi:hypothetical protein